MRSSMLVRHVDRDRFDIDIRGHVIAVDQPVDDGGDDTAPTPTELFVAGLASCVGFYARRYLARHGLPVRGLSVRGDYAIEPGPVRVADIRIELVLPDGVPAERRAGVLAVASHCTVHNTLKNPPPVTVVLADPADAGKVSA
jgi:putative redox protein